MTEQIYRGLGVRFKVKIGRKGFGGLCGRVKVQGSRKTDIWGWGGRRNVCYECFTDYVFRFFSGL